MATIRKIYIDEYAHWVAEQAAAEKAGMFGLVQPTAGVAYAFWHGLDPSKLTLPMHLAHGLESCVVNVGFTAVYLLTYQLITNAPLGVTVIDAIR